MRRFAVAMILLAFGLLTSCAAPHGAKPKAPKAPPGSREPPITSPDKKVDAERLASNALIEEGRQSLAHGTYDHAADLFQEAVSVDPTNGTGYYYLALVKFKTGEYGEVSGLLEKAKSLLSGEPEWTERLDDLESQLKQNAPSL